MASGINAAVEYFGSQRALAKRIGVTPMAISQWKRRRIPIERAAQIDRVSGGAVPKELLRPDVFGPAPAGELKKAG
ncbi:Cro/CI family transcriptional regulator [Microbulbifer sp.]|uniref:transcriptional regulator n=1 Tax=Microbulbifer sp. TaxID=1908541 RepID=UPI00258F867B|nr:Cro/CI family transcriptional regulator [Microbulbifer sp.]